MKTNLLFFFLALFFSYINKSEAISPFSKKKIIDFTESDSTILPSAYDRLHLGVELEVTPFILKGYILQGWMSLGNAPFRVRINIAQSYIPSFLLDKKIEKEKLNSISLNLDFFLKKNFQAFYFTGGLAYFNQYITSKEAILNTNNQNILHEYKNFKNHSIAISLGLGYNYFFYKGFYIAPWVGFHTRINNGQDIALTPEFTYKPTFVYPEIALKIGWHIGRIHKKY